MFQFLKTSITKVKGALSKTASFFSKRLEGIFSKPLDEDNIEMLEEILYEADLGSSVVDHFIQKVQSFAGKNPNASKEEYIDILEQTAASILSKEVKSLSKQPENEKAPKMILMVGVNGSGKTTSIAKLGKMYKDAGKKVLFACGDTFRAAATEQLALHAKNLGVDVVLAKHGADPSGVIFDAMEKGKHGNYDVVICDTAGRLESKTELLEQLKKIDTVAKKGDKNAPHEVYLTIDAGLGGTCLDQVEKFNQFIPLTGLILTKIDSTAKGGVALSIYKKHELPIVYVGFGETLCDFSLFDAKSYAKALFKE
ncbi:MAG: Signal recognition particle receptor FtsY [Chlamydiia bacterium]|nr:Signal recognition particle receptor FtsY [Chlamydiia bacterium]MCH9618233.1 Signal recognition particle receptor FtsY [Chlamydiia bacterium]MCH9624464.1 Signal recognition particle receptor FtsY [Chlamydiia bacterium]